MSDRFPDRPGDGASERPAAAWPEEDITELAARFGITVDRILQELAVMAFTRITDIVEWDAAGLSFKPSGELSQNGKAAAIAEVVTSAKTGRPYRIKLHDKRAALDLLARCIGMLPRKNGSNQTAQDDDEDPLDFIIRELDDRAAEGRLASDPSESEQPEAAAGC